MPLELYDVNQYKVQSLLSKIEEGEIAIPEIQRPFKWSGAKVRDFIDSLYRGYPVGYLIVWKTEDARLKGGGASGGKLILVDGQQRVTALRTALIGKRILDENYQEKRIQIAFHPEDEKFEVANPAIKRNPAWISDIGVLFSSEKRVRHLLSEYCEKNHIESEAKKDEIDDRLERLESIKNNLLGLIELKSGLDVEIVTEIFIRVNSKAVALNAADFAMSKMAANEKYGGHQLRKCIDYFCHLASRPEAYGTLARDVDFVETGYFQKMSWLKTEMDDIYDPSYTDMLRVAFMSEFKRGRLADLVALLSGRDFETREYKEESAEKSFDRLKESVLRYMNEANFKRFIGILRSAGIVKSAMVGSMNAVNFAYVVFLTLRAGSAHHEEIEELTRRWYVMSVLTNRYSGGPVESAFAQDIAMIDRLSARASLDQIEGSELSDVFWNVSLPGRLNVSVKTSPYFKVFLASLAKANDKGFLSRDHTVRDLLLGDSEIHHVFPKSYLAKRGYTKGVYNQLANYVVVQSEINRVISDTPPTVYFKAAREQCSAHASIALGSRPRKIYGSIGDAEELRANYEQHCIPYEILENANGSLKELYDDFCEERRKLMAKKMSDYYRGLSSAAP